MSPAEEIDLTRVLCTLEDLAATGSRAFRLGGGDWPLKGFVVRVAGGAPKFDRKKYCVRERKHTVHKLKRK